ncbi:hypothetical protein BH18GEM1_BH18GEM1_14270 [soil metagenome]
MRIRWPARRTLPSRIDLTPNSWAIARTLRFFPLNVKDEVREATLSCGSLVNRLINSSEIPSLKNSFSGSIVGLDLDPAFGKVPSGPGDADAPGFGDAFQSRRDVDAIAEDVVVLDDHVPKVDAGVEKELSLLRKVGIAPRHGLQDLDGTAKGVDHAREFDQQAVTGCLHEAAAVGLDLRVDQLGTVRLQAGQRSLLVDAHKAAVPDNIGGGDCREPAICSRSLQGGSYL